MRGSFTYEIPVEVWFDDNWHVVYTNEDNLVVRLPIRLAGIVARHLSSIKGTSSKELTIHLSVDWYYDPGCIHMVNGDPGYPPEGDEERLVQTLTIDGDEIDRDVATEIVELFEYIIEEYEFPKECYNEP